MRCNACRVTMELVVKATGEKTWKCLICRVLRTKEPPPIRKEEDASLVLAWGDE
jgi:hypothetical protein